MIDRTHGRHVRSIASHARHFTPRIMASTVIKKMLLLVIKIQPGSVRFLLDLKPQGTVNTFGNRGVHPPIE
jgi:hypothetical protein